MSPNAIAKVLAERPVNEVWTLFMRNARTLQPFWEQTVKVFSQRCGAEDKREVHCTVIADAFRQMDDWRFKRIPYVKARRKEIDSAISFIRNKALERTVAKMRVAPAARNAAAVLRSLLYVACHGYKDEQVPGLLAFALYNIAAVRILLPFGISDLAVFHPGHSKAADIDPLVTMLERAGLELGIQPAIQRLFAEARVVWEHIEHPLPLELAPSVWNEEDDGLNAQLHYASVIGFHRKQ